MPLISSIRLTFHISHAFDLQHQTYLWHLPCPWSLASDLPLTSPMPLISSIRLTFHISHALDLQHQTYLSHLPCPWSPATDSPPAPTDIAATNEHQDGTDSGSSGTGTGCFLAPRYGWASPAGYVAPDVLLKFVWSKICLSEKWATTCRNWLIKSGMSWPWSFCEKWLLNVMHFILPLQAKLLWRKSNTYLYFIFDINQQKKSCT